MSVLKIAFILLTIATILFFVTAGFFGEALQSIGILSNESMSNLDNTMNPLLMAFF